MARPPTLYEWADERFGGGLEQRLREWVELGYSTEAIAFDLRAGGVEVSAETVRRWLHKIGAFS